MRCMVVSSWMGKVRSYTLAHLPFLIEDKKCLIDGSACMHTFSSIVIYRDHGVFSAMGIMRTWARRASAYSDDDE